MSINRLICTDKTADIYRHVFHISLRALYVGHMACVVIYKKKGGGENKKHIGFRKKLQFVDSHRKKKKILTPSSQPWRFV